MSGTIIKRNIWGPGNVVFIWIPHLFFTFKAFKKVFLKAIERAPPDEDVSARVLSLTEAITHSALQYTCQGLFQRDRLTFLTHAALQVSGPGLRRNRNASHPPTATSSLPPPALCHSHQSLPFSALTLSSIRACQYSRVRSYWLSLTAQAPLSSSGQLWQEGGPNWQNANTCQDSTCFPRCCLSAPAVLHTSTSKGVKLFWEPLVCVWWMGTSAFRGPEV